MPPARKRVTPRPSASTEGEPFTRFVGEVVGVLRRPRVTVEGQVLTLAGYLEREERAGDEQSVVDPLVRDLLTALGWGLEHIAYNRGEGRIGRPDFQVTAPEEGPFANLVGSPLFIVESKSTATRDLDRSQPGRDESPLEQLRRYVCSLGVQGRVGLLCNGWVLEGWTFHERDTPVLRIDLAALSRHVALPAFEGTLLPVFAEALGVLWGRFSLDAFRAAGDDIDRIRASVALSEEDRRRILAEVMQSGDPRLLDVRLAEAAEVAWTAGARKVREHRERLVETLGRLIEEMSADVRHQLDDLLDRVRLSDATLDRAEEAANLEGRLKTVLFLRKHLALDDEAFEARCLRPLAAWRERPRKGRSREQAEAVWEALKSALVVETAPTGEQLGLGLDEVAASEPRRRVREYRDRVGKDIQAALLEFCEVAVDVALAREQIHRENASAVAAHRAWNLWVQRMSSTVLVGADGETLQREFARQTAYIYVVRLLLVRICEDKGLFRRKFSDGGLTSWRERSEQYLDYAAGRSYEYLTRMAYECAQNVYMHFYGASEIFDWYQMDEKRLVAVLAALNTFNLREIDDDIIGAVYGTYLREGKHETGRYYTARSVVRLMLDQAGWTRERLLGGALGRDGALRGLRLLDPACGSGSFLVEACRRLLDTFRGSDGRVPTEHIPEALSRVRDALHGFDINPFACYLAELNLLIQVLDLVRQARDEGVVLSVERFRVFCEDSILVDETLAVLDAGFLAVEGRMVDAIRARTGPWADGFDVIVANPPYVRADEGKEILEYRRRVERQTWFTTAHKKWDLYVPFVERAYQLLSDDPEARACFITIISIGNAPYAAPLRELLTRDVTLHALVFARKVKLFSDAKWQDNLIFSFSRRRPEPGLGVGRYNLRVEPDGTARVDPDSVLPVTDADRLFNPRDEVELDETGCVALERICYISKGMVLHSNEHLQPGQEVEVPLEYDPIRFGEEEVRQGPGSRVIRHRSFRKEDLVSSKRTELHARRTLGGEEVLRGGLGRPHYLEYGPHTRCPARVSRPTFPELYNRPKLMFGTFTGAAVDEGGEEGFYVVSHSLSLGIRWCDLEHVEARVLWEAREALQPDVALSAGFSLWYLQALFLSDPVQAWLAANKRSMKDHVYPDDLRVLPIKVIPPEAQLPFEELARERHAIWATLTRFREAGVVEGQPGAERPRVLAGETLSAIRPEITRWIHLFQLDKTGLVAWTEAVLGADLSRLTARDRLLRRGRDALGQIPESVADGDRIASVLARLLAEGGRTLSDRGQELVPADPAGWRLLADRVEEAEDRVRALVARRAEIDRSLDEMAWALYRLPSPTLPGGQPEEGS